MSNDYDKDMITAKLPQYIGKRFPDPMLHHGRIPPAAGVKCIQIARANAADAAADDGTCNTYKHAADIAYYAGRFYVQYLTNPHSEHTGAGKCVLASSRDCIAWERADMQVSFPEYRIPACEITDVKGGVHSFTGREYGVYHQRMSFYYAKKADVMLLLAFVGHSPKPWITPWNVNGIGRLVRRIFPDGSLGEIFFIRPNWQAGWSRELLNYPLYDESADTAFAAACEELLADRLFVQQWAEENGDADPIIAIKHPPKGSYQAFWWYHLPKENELGAIWKHALVAYSADGGRTFSAPVRSESLVMSGQKSFIRSTADGRYAMVYDPTLDTQHRYPLCVTTADDGVHFDNMLLVCGRVPQMRHGGFWKDFGLQYMRGILEDLPQPPDGDLHMVYSVNKEDIWTALVPAPIRGGTDETFNEDFERQPQAAWRSMNVYSPCWARVTLAAYNGKAALRLSDADRYDTAEAARVFAPRKKLSVHIELTPMQTDSELWIELCDPTGIVAARLIFGKEGVLYHRVTCNWEAAHYTEGMRYALDWSLDCETHTYTLSLNGVPVTAPQSDKTVFLMMTAVREIGFLRLRTGEVNETFPTPDTLPDEDPELHLEQADIRQPEKVYYLHRLCLTGE